MTEFSENGESVIADAELDILEDEKDMDEEQDDSGTSQIYPCGFDSSYIDLRRRYLDV